VDECLSHAADGAAEQQYRQRFRERKGECRRHEQSCADHRDGPWTTQIGQMTSDRTSQDAGDTRHRDSDADSSEVLSERTRDVPRQSWDEQSDREKARRCCNDYCGRPASRETATE
jgi:hypothetical protein